MPPKSQPRKASVSSKDAAPTTAAKAAKNAAMLPPPVPAPPLGILEAEVNALTTCLRNSVVKTGQVYGFYSDARRLEIDKYASSPPRSLTSALGREVEKYDQLCDAMEAHLLRAIAVLQRDLSREEHRLEAEAAAAAVTVPTESSTTTPPTSTPSVLPAPSLGAAPTELILPVSEAMAQSQKPVAITPARRQSTISLSSLQRPAFPHKLDLSSPALRLNPDELLPSGLSSPVTLAPRSSRASLPPDIVMAALNDAANRPVDIDLTIDPDDMQSGVGQSGGDMVLDDALGSSADKPIELDLDADIFENAASAHVDANPQTGRTYQHHTLSGQNSRPDVKPKVETDGLGISILHAFNNVEGDDPFALGDQSMPTAQLNNGGASQIQPPSLPSQSRQVPASVTFPPSMMAGLGGSSRTVDPSESSLQPGEEPFVDMQGIDLSSLSQSGFSFFDEHTTGPDINMMEMDLFNMDAESNVQARPS
ncbi:hypothetical protein B0H21DRAFT_890900 [Amylocystis lapponica]|nr:hypothetical protein B0H21DRAFT_890900 [Amylocystis lapponica]